MINRKIILLSASLAALCIQAGSASASWYAGGSAGATLLTPDTQDSGFSLTQDKSFLGGVFVGYDFNRRLSAELAYHHLGEAELSNDAGSAGISYSAISGSGLIYVYGDADDLAERYGKLAYIRLGLNAMKNVSSLPLERADGHGIWAGIGMEWSMSDNINLRGEISSFDGDVQSANVALVYRPRTQITTASLPLPSDKPSIKPDVKPTPAPAPKPEVVPEPEIVPVPEPEVVAAPEPEIVPVPEPEVVAVPEPEIVPVPEPEVVAVPEPEIVPVPKPAPEPDVVPVPKAAPKPAPKPVETKPVIIAEADCVSPAVNEPVNASGCALFSGVQEGLDFEPGTARLSASAGRVLDELALNLKRHPTTVVEIQGHTDLQRNAAVAKNLAKQRVFAVAKQLVQRGISVKRLRARAFGSSQPIAGNATEQGRQLNNRIELRVLR